MTASILSEGRNCLYSTAVFQKRERRDTKKKRFVENQFKFQEVIHCCGKQTR